MNKVAPFAKGDILKVVFKYKTGSETQQLVVTWVERLPTSWYFGYKPHGEQWCGFGCSKVYDETKPFGMVSWEKISEQKEAESKLPNLFRNPAYDLMHDPVRS